MRGKHRLLALLLALTMICAPLSARALAAEDAPTPEEVIAALPLWNLTADWAQDLLMIARSQIGYTESQTDTIENEYGQVGYTCYGDYFGLPYGEWCAMFLCFCMDYSAIPDDSFPRSAVCRLWLSALEERHLYRPAEDYIPVPGDIVFFGPTQEKANHVGIVTYVRCDGDKVKTLGVLEGNADARVAENHYAAAYSAILGYGTLSYAQRMETREALLYADSGRGALWDGAPYSIRVSGIFPEDCHVEAYPAEAIGESPLPGWRLVLVDREGCWAAPEPGGVFVDILWEEAADALSGWEEPVACVRLSGETTWTQAPLKITETGASFAAEGLGTFFLGNGASV